MKLMCNIDVPIIGIIPFTKYICGILQANKTGIHAQFIGRRVN